MEAVLPPSQMVFFPMMLVIPVVLMLVENSSLSPKYGSYSPHMMGGKVGGQKAVASRLLENNPQVDHHDQ